MSEKDSFSKPASRLSKEEAEEVLGVSMSANDWLRYRLSDGTIFPDEYYQKSDITEREQLTHGEIYQQRRGRVIDKEDKQVELLVDKIKKILRSRKDPKAMAEAAMMIGDLLKRTKNFAYLESPGQLVAELEKFVSASIADDEINRSQLFAESAQIIINEYIRLLLEYYKNVVEEKALPSHSQIIMVWGPLHSLFGKIDIDKLSQKAEIAAVMKWLYQNRVATFYKGSSEQTVGTLLHACARLLGISYEEIKRPLKK